MFIIEEFADGGDLLGLLFKYGGKIPEVRGSAAGQGSVTGVHAGGAPQQEQGRGFVMQHATLAGAHAAWKGMPWRTLPGRRATLLHVACQMPAAYLFI